ncbi:coagulation factor XI-like isoform X1 [Scomber scombrus]|uniref:coagulation factor XI-like isoform X1 n=1 Tax=Scomber scombrus TaxID=13677 RepID=UPI002DDB9FAE|nr:coagulation factor XI-like isoform X1 [Scomber scombrus]
MGTNLILVFLLSLCSISFSQECSRGLLEDVDFPGTDITFLYSPDVNHCQLLCTEHASCQFFTFVRPDWTRDDRHFYCYLKSTPSGQPKTETSLLGVTSGFSLKNCFPYPEHCISQVYKNVDFLGADYRSLFTSDYEECQRVCTKDPGCKFFTFVNANFQNERIRHKCHLKYTWTIPRTPIVERTAGVVSGFTNRAETPNPSDTACQGELFSSTDIRGSDFEMLPAASPEHCQTLCSAHPRCTYFSYDSNDLKCYLKSNANEMVTSFKERVTSGLPAHLCQLNNSWVKDVHEGIDFRGSDMRFELADDPEECQKKCTQEPNCQFYTYVNRNFRDKTFWRRCYLKRVITIPAPPKVNKLADVVSGFSQKNCFSSAHSG